jgi:hypothetical protein
MRRARRAAVLLALPLVLALALAPGAGATGPPGSYTTQVFADGFEGGSLIGWDGLLGNGSATVLPTAAHTGGFGLELSNGPQQFQVAVKAMPSTLVDSSTSFWVRIAAGTGFQMVAQARDSTSSAHMWDLAYDGGQHTFFFYPYSATGSTEIATGAGTAPADTWIHVEVQYTATATGGARLYLNDQTQPNWGVAGDYTRTGNLQRIQLWNDGANTTDFDDVFVGTPVQPLTAPGAPTGVVGIAGDHSAALSWTAPSSNGGSPITGYRITPYIGAAAQSPVLTGSSATLSTVTGLTNGTAYTFKVAAINDVGTGSDSPESAAIKPGPGYTTVVFSDGFESGTLAAWNALLGNGSATVVAGAAHAGAYGLELANGAQQFQVLAKRLTSPLVDSSTSFWVKVAAGNGFQTVAQARDDASAAHMWDLTYDGAQHSLSLFAYTGTGSTEIQTGGGTVPANTWVQVEVRYAATATGGAGIYLNGQTRPGWTVTGNYTRSTNLQRLQLWNDGGLTTDFDQVSVAVPMGPGTVPGTPTAVTGTAGNASVNLSWTAPTSDGGSPITGYRITPYIGSAAQAPVLTGSAATSFTVTGLTNGTSYTFTVAAINAVGTGSDSAPSPPLIAANGPSVPGAPTGVTGVPGDRSVALTWTAPASDGGRQITSYRITPYIGSTAQTAINTGSAATSHTVTGLTNGTAYKFTVAATNTVGTGPASAPSGSMTPQLGYTETVFADGFESGDLAGWNGTPGSGAASVLTGATRTGSFGLRMTNTSGQYTFAVKALTSPLTDSSSSFWVRLGSGSGLQMVAQARDSSSSVYIWHLYYDWGRGGFVFDAFTNTASAEVFTGVGSGTVGSWMKVEIQYTATATGGARIYLNGQTQPSWGVAGDYTRTSNFQRLQLWNDAVGTTEFDDVRVSTTPPPGATAPGAPTGVSGSPRDQGVTLTWTAPSSTGGSAISGYRITPFIGGVAQAAVVTDYPVTTQTVSGLTNGTAYTFSVAAINGVGTGAESVASAAVTPSGATAPGNPTNVTAVPGDTNATVGWTAPASDGGAPITGYRITPYIGSTAQTPVTVAGASTTYTVTGLANGTAYTFVVAATNSVGTGGNSAASATVTPRPALSQYTNVVFSDGFETGNLSRWTGVAQGTGTTSVVSGAAHTGGFGARIATLDTQYGYFTKALSAPLVDSVSSFWIRTGTGTRVATVAQARDGSSSLVMWQLAYDGGRHGFVFYPFRSTGSTEIFTGTNTAASGTWLRVSVEYKADAVGGGAQLYVNGQTQPGWGVSGDYSRTANLQVLQLWNEGLTANDFDDVVVATLPPPGVNPPGAPTAVTGSPLDHSVSLSWSAPSADGGGPIGNYRVTPYIGGVAQTPIETGSAGTSYTVTGLANGTAYTFTVAAGNAAGFGTESNPSAAVTPSSSTVPGAPTGVTGAPRDGAVALTWTAPASNGGSPITSYRITPYIGSNAQTTVSTGSASTSYTVTGLTNGTAYTFTVAAVNAVGTGAASAPSGPVTPAVPPPNPIVVENQQQGTTAWQLTSGHKALNQEIEGYASLTSVNKGNQIDFMVSLSSNAQYTMDIYRTGWYPQGTNPDGSSCAPSCGGRLMRHVGPLDGFTQAACPQVTTPNTPDYGLTECAWTPTYTLTVPAAWTTGNYLVKLKRLDGQQLENYMTFVVRDDSSTAPIVYSMDVTTWQAYNYWGGTGNGNVGYSLYGRYNDSTGSSTGGRAYTVSFDRPYADGAVNDGAGDFFAFDFPMIKWMESQGLDVTYVTSVDLESNPNLLLGHRVFTNAGHDEYYSDGMRSNITSAIGSGVNMAFFSANNFYYRITWAPSASGRNNRRIHCDKNALPPSTTYEWRLLSPQHPENEIGGVMTQGVANLRPFLVSDANSWIYAGTGLSTYTGNGTDHVITGGPNQNALPGIIGYEFDARASTTPGLSAYASFEPPGLQTLGHSFVPASDGNATDSWSDATFYTAPSGAMVFSAGTIQWSWGVEGGYADGYCRCSSGAYVNSATQRITANILNRFSGD